MFGKRDCYFDGVATYCDDNTNWWYSPTGYIVKYAVVTAIFLFFFIWIVGGYIHAQRRLRKGLAPLAYHRWLVPRYMRTPTAQNSQAYYVQQQPNTYYNSAPNRDGYSMPGYPEPPPLYNHDAPPSYQPPAGGSKINPQQQTGVVREENAFQQAPSAEAGGSAYVEQPLPARTTKSNMFRWMRR